MSPSELEVAMLALPAEERLRLAHLLFDSVEEDVDAGIGEAWLGEVKHRTEEVVNGAVELVPGEEVFKKAIDKRGR